MLEKDDAKASTHASKEYQRSATTRMSEFLAKYEDPSQSVDSILDTQGQVIGRNKQVIESLFMWQTRPGYVGSPR